MPISDQEMRACRVFLEGVQAGQPVDELNGRHTTLQSAAMNNFRYLAGVCLILGADPSLRDNNDHNVLGLAAINGSFDVIREIESFYHQRRQSETLRDLIREEQGRRRVFRTVIPATGVSFINLLRRRADMGEDSQDLRHFLELENVIDERIKEEAEAPYNPRMGNLERLLRDDRHSTIQRIIDGFDYVDRDEISRDLGENNERLELLEIIEQYTEELGKEERDTIEKEEFRKEELEKIEHELDLVTTRCDDVVQIYVDDVGLSSASDSESEEELKKEGDSNRAESPSLSPQSPDLSGTLAIEQQRRDQDRGL